jgi:hypothetical protein
VERGVLGKQVGRLEFGVYGMRVRRWNLEITDSYRRREGIGDGFRG